VTDIKKPIIEKPDVARAWLKKDDLKKVSSEGTEGTV